MVIRTCQQMEDSVARERRSLLIAMLLLLCTSIGCSQTAMADAIVGPYEVIAYEHPNFQAITKSWRLAPGMRQLLVEDVGRELNDHIDALRIGEKVGVALFDGAYFAGPWWCFESTTRDVGFPTRNRASSLIVYPKEAGGPLGVELQGNWTTQFFPLPELATESVAGFPTIGGTLNDAVGYVQIYGNYSEMEASLFEHEEFQGKQLTLPEPGGTRTLLPLSQYQMDRAVSSLRLVWTGSRRPGLETPPTIAEPVSGFGTATIDGMMSPAEWDSAASIEFEAILPPDYRYASDTAPAVLYVMNDRENVYLGVRINRVGFSGGGASFAFDNDNDGITEPGEDVLQLGHPGAFVDSVVHTACGSPVVVLCSEADQILGTSRDGTGASSDNGAFTFFELSHPLNSADLNDFGLVGGDTVGFAMTLWLSVGIEPALSIAADARAVPVVGYYQIRIVETELSSFTTPSTGGDPKG